MALTTGLLCTLTFPWSLAMHLPELRPLAIMRKILDGRQMEIAECPHVCRLSSHSRCGGIGSDMRRGAAIHLRRQRERQHDAFDQGGSGGSGILAENDGIHWQGDGPPTCSPAAPLSAPTSVAVMYTSYPYSNMLTIWRVIDDGKQRDPSILPSH